jgi:catechol 2,3-dioxygenase-like lactoylglutathione lyase family enzyme
MKANPANRDAAPTVERAIPVLGAVDLDQEDRFYARLGFEVLHRYDGYLVLGRGDLEIHLAHREDHDPTRTAGVAYLRVADAQAIWLSAMKRGGVRAEL